MTFDRYAAATVAAVLLAAPLAASPGFAVAQAVHDVALSLPEERSIGHIDPGASSCALLTVAICGVLMEQEVQ